MAAYGVGGVLIASHRSRACVRGWTNDGCNAWHARCDVRPTVTFPAAQHDRPLVDTKL